MHHVDKVSLALSSFSHLFPSSWPSNSSPSSFNDLAEYFLIVRLRLRQPTPPPAPAPLPSLIPTWVVSFSTLVDSHSCPSSSHAGLHVSLPTVILRSQALRVLSLVVTGSILPQACLPSYPSHGGPVSPGGSRIRDCAERASRIHPGEP